jgi:hypothetical protein
MGSLCWRRNRAGAALGLLGGEAEVDAVWSNPLSPLDELALAVDAVGLALLESP